MLAAAALIIESQAADMSNLHRLSQSQRSYHKSHKGGEFQLSQDEIEDTLHETFAVESDEKKMPSVEQILSDEDKEEKEKEKPKEPEEEKKEDFENMSLTEQLEAAKKQAADEEVARKKAEVEKKRQEKIKAEEEKKRKAEEER